MRGLVVVPVPYPCPRPRLARPAPQDATAAVGKTGDGLANVTYHATTQGKEPGHANRGGNIVLSSTLSWYAR